MKLAAVGHLHTEVFADKAIGADCDLVLAFAEFTDGEASRGI